MNLQKLTLLPICLYAMLLMFVVSACERIKPAEVQPYVTEIEMPEEFNVDKIIFLSNTKGFAAGGKKNAGCRIYMTTDGGETWVKRYGNDSLSINDMVFCNDRVGFACGDSMMLLKTIDGGLSWKVYNLPNLPYPEYRVPYNSLAALDSTHIFVAGGENYYKGLTSELEPGANQCIHHSFDNEIRDILFVDENLGFFAAYGQVLITEDGGNTFSYLEIDNEYFYDLEYFQNTIWLLGRYGKLYTSGDSGNSLTLQKEFGEMTLQDLWICNTDSYICGGGGFLLISRDQGESWYSVSGCGNTNLNSISVTPSGEVWVGGDDGKLFVLNRHRGAE